ncbi:unnamed protein product [Boreogadus saida]
MEWRIKKTLSDLIPLCASIERFRESQEKHRAAVQSKSSLNQLTTIPDPPHTPTAGEGWSSKASFLSHVRRSSAGQQR